MCHPELPEGRAMPDARTRESEIPLPSGELLPALLASPEGPPRGAVLVVNDVFGRSPFYEDLSRRLAVAGFVAADPEFFFREGPLPDQTREAAFERRARHDPARAVADLDVALDWLRAESGVAGRLGTIGFCMGGTYVLQLAARREDLASVCFYGFPGNVAPDEVDRIQGPLLGFWGDQDAGVGMDNVEALRKNLVARVVDHHFTVYSGLGHGFMKASGLEPAGDGYEQACEAWTRTLQFYRRHLG